MTIKEEYLTHKKYGYSQKDFLIKHGLTQYKLYTLINKDYYVKVKKANSNGYIQNTLKEIKQKWGFNETQIKKLLLTYTKTEILNGKWENGKFKINIMKFGYGKNNE